MSRDIPPAIRREFTHEDELLTVMAQPMDAVKFRRGFGDCGYRVEVVKLDCPHGYCSFDRMVRRVDVNPEMADTAEYWCLNPNCQHFVGEQLSHACHGSYPQNIARGPAIYE